MRAGLAALALFGAAGCALPDAALEPEQAGPDFALQGEYAAAGAPWAAQLVAQGGGAFEAAFLRGGLPGAGWDGSPRVRARSAAAGGGLHFESADGALRAELAAGRLRVSSAQGERFELARTERRSPTLGAPPSAGALALFDGRSGAGDFDGRVDARGLLEAGAVSRSHFGSFRLHLEFRTPFEPGGRGQFRGNSGVYLQGRYEIQVLDSFGLEGADDECGALYGLKPPDLNMALPPLAWQTYDVDFEAARFDAQGRKLRPARVSVEHNGVRIHERVALPGPSGRGDAEGPEPGPIRLQDHWHPVVYRNLWLEPR